jgi:hypothetical protein
MNEMDELALEELEQKRKNTYRNIKFLGFVSILVFAMLLSPLCQIELLWGSA